VVLGCELEANKNCEILPEDRVSQRQVELTHRVLQIFKDQSVTDLLRLLQVTGLTRKGLRKSRDKASPDNSFFHRRMEDEQSFSNFPNLAWVQRYWCAAARLHQTRTEGHPPDALEYHGFPVVIRTRR
jgi:hypothetical protein